MEPLVRMRHDEASRSFILTCDLCGLREKWYKYWPCSRAVDAHREIHDLELPPRLPEDVPQSTRMDENIPQALRH